MSFKNRYSLIDRLLHRLAFATTWAQRGTADVEERLFRRELDAVRLGAPVLITGLPRAGTTILLNMLAGLDTFASHTYRDMPFVLCPLLWSGIAKPFHRETAPRERAHGDGIQLTSDSPEAFEEVLWKRFWPRRYRGAAIDPWDRCDDEEFVEFFANHMRKIVALRARTKPSASRYVSKNNLNIARIPAIFDAFADAIVLAPFREPLQHAASLRRQHERFLAMHADDGFAKRYMAGIGHFDFGANLKPINFGGWFDGRDIAEATGIAFWLDYWIAAYRHVLQHAKHDRLHLICFEALATAPNLSGLSERLSLCDPGALQAAASQLKQPTPHAIDVDGVDPARIDEAGRIYMRMQELALV